MVNYAKRLIVISRPFYCFLIAWMFIGGVLFARAPWSAPAWLGLFFVIFPMGVIVFGINDISDEESDSLNYRKGGYEGAVINSSEKNWLVPAIVASCVFSVGYFLINGLWVATLMVAAVILFALTYSLKPIRLKSIPVVDSVSNGLWVTFIFLMGYNIANHSLTVQYPKTGYVLAILFTVIAFHALTTLFDMEVDKQAGDKTIALALGARLTIVFAMALFIASALVVSISTRAVYVYYLIACLTLLLMLLRPTQQIMHRLTMALVWLIPVLSAYLVAIRNGWL